MKARSRFLAWNAPLFVCQVVLIIVAPSLTTGLVLGILIGAANSLGYAEGRWGAPYPAPDAVDPHAPNPGTPSTRV